MLTKLKYKSINFKAIFLYISRLVETKKEENFQIYLAVLKIESVASLFEVCIKCEIILVILLYVTVLTVGA